MSSCELPIIHKLFSIPEFAYYSQNYSGIISASLGSIGRKRRRGRGRGRGRGRRGRGGRERSVAS